MKFIAIFCATGESRDKSRNLTYREFKAKTVSPVAREVQQICQGMDDLVWVRLFHVSHEYAVLTGHEYAVLPADDDPANTGELECC